MYSTIAFQHDVTVAVNRTRVTISVDIREIANGSRTSGVGLMLSDSQAQALLDGLMIAMEKPTDKPGQQQPAG